jgi:TonB family protein
VTCLGKWLLASCALHLLAAAGMAMLCAASQKPAMVIDLSQFGHSWREPSLKQAGICKARPDPAPTALPRQPAAVTPRPVTQKRVVQERPPAKNLKPGAQPATAASASGDNATATAAASGGLAASRRVGLGAGGTAGNGGEGGEETGGQGAYRGMYFGFIKDLVQKAAVYPLQARRMGWQGTATISFAILKNGGITDVAVLKSSGHAVLDSSACAAVKKLGPQPCPPDRVEIRLPVVFRLTGA